MNYRRPSRALRGWSEDAAQAVQASPDYFMRWYTIKSLGLVAAIAGVAYYVGKEAGRSGR